MPARHNAPASPEFLQGRQREVDRLVAVLSSLPSGPVVLELGCGHGHFLAAYAAASIASGAASGGTPKTFLAIDKNAERIRRAGKKSQRARVPVTWVAGRVEDLLQAWPSGLKIEEVFVLFPDPWPKLRHHKHRFVNERLLRQLAQVSALGALFYFRTDHLGYFQAVKELLAVSAGWRLREDVVWPQQLPPTLFQERHPVYYSLIAQFSG